MKPQNYMCIRTPYTAKTGNKMNNWSNRNMLWKYVYIYAFTFYMYVQAHDSWEP